MLALVGLLPRVESLVASQRRVLTEAPPTVLALVWPISRVDPCVPPHTPLPVQSLALFALPPCPIWHLDEHAVYCLRARWVVGSCPQDKFHLWRQLLLAGTP